MDFCILKFVKRLIKSPKLSLAHLSQTVDRDRRLWWDGNRRGREEGKQEEREAHSHTVPKMRTIRVDPGILSTSPATRSEFVVSIRVKLSKCHILCLIQYGSVNELWLAIYFDITFQTRSPLDSSTCQVW